MSHMSDITIRDSRPTDQPELLRLAALDSQAFPNGELVVAETDGEIVAAYSAVAHRAIANPFRRTAGVVSMLKLRAETDFPAARAA